MSNNSVPISFSVVISTLKKAIKSKGYTYKTLADEIGMSESGLKKNLSANDCSLQRILLICQTIEFPFEDLVAISAQEEPVQEVELPPEVQEELVANIDCFNLYWKLAYERIPLERAREELSLNKKKMLNYLVMLDRLNLIKLMPGDKVQVLKTNYLVKWVGNGPLYRYIKSNWGQGLVQHVVDQPSSDQHFSLRYYKLTEESYEDLLSTIEQCNKEFSQRSNREIKLFGYESLKTVSMVAAIAPKSPMKQER